MVFGVSFLSLSGVLLSILAFFEGILAFFYGFLAFFEDYSFSDSSSLFIKKLVEPHFE
jgi:hypothetical protein